MVWKKKRDIAARNAQLDAQEKEKEKKKLKIENEDIHKTLINFKEISERIAAEQNIVELLKKYKNLNEFLENSPSLVIDIKSYSIEVNELLKYINNPSTRKDVRKLLFYAFCNIKLKSYDMKKETIPNFNVFFNELKMFLIKWAFFFTADEDTYLMTDWMKLLKNYYLLHKVIIFNNEWDVNGAGNQFLYIVEKEAIAEKKPEDHELLNELTHLSVSENLKTSESELTKQIDENTTLMERRLKKKEESEKKKSSTTVSPTFKTQYVVSPSERRFHTWFTQIFMDMNHSIKIMVTINSPKWSRIQLSPECTKFCKGMDVFVELYLQRTNLKGFLNEFIDMKIFSNAFLPGLMSSSETYQDVINLDVWRDIYLNEIEILSNTFSSKDFNICSYWNDLTKYEFFSPWARFYIIKTVFQIVLPRFIPDQSFLLQSIIYQQDFDKATSYFLHYSFCGHAGKKIYDHGWNAIFSVLYESLNSDLLQKEDVRIRNFINIINELETSKSKGIKCFFPPYPTQGLIESKTYPENIVLLIERNSKSSLLDHKK